jgi:uncharacterized protein
MNMEIKKVDINKLDSGKNTVFYKSLGRTIAADMWLLDGFDPSKKYPSLVYTRVGTQVKEQTGATYGRKMSLKGYIFLAFDPINFGESEVDIKNYETMHNVIPNTRDSISFLRTFDFVDRNRFFGLGLCGGAPYICNVALADKRLKAVVTVVGNFDAAAGFFGTIPPEVIDQMLTIAAEAQQHYYETGKFEMANIFAGMPIPPPDEDPEAIKEGYQYYFVRADEKVCQNYSPNYPTLAPLYEPTLSFTTAAKFFRTPFLAVAGSNAFTRDMDREIYDMIPGEKDWLEIEGATQTALYDIDRYVDQAVEKIDSFYKDYGKNG